MLKKMSALILLLFNLSAFAEETVLEVIPLSNRPATEIQPLIEPLLSSGDTVTGRDFSLIVKTTPARLVEIKNLIKKIDTAATNLTIRVMQSKDKTAAELNAGADVGVVIPLPHPEKARGRINARLHQSQQRSHNNSEQLIRVLEGQQAYIQTGTNNPVQNITQYNYGSGQRVVSTQTLYIDATTGFYVLPRLNGDEVQLEISPWSNTMKPAGLIETQSAQTVIRTKLGQWVEIGAVDEQSQHSGSGLFSTQQGQSQNAVRILLHVEKAN
jgi:type II secretory pathway component GspD/PulD (secretin)